MIASGFILSKSKYTSKDGEIKYVNQVLIGDINSSGFLDDPKVVQVITASDTCSTASYLAPCVVTLKLSEYYSQESKTRVIQPKYTDVKLVGKGVI